MIVITLYIISITCLIVVSTIGIVLYRRYLADKPRRARNAMRYVQIALCAAAGSAQLSKIRSTSFKSKEQRLYKKLGMAKTVVNTASSITSVGKDIEPAPVYRFN